MRIRTNMVYLQRARNITNSAIADDTDISLIRDQVEMGVAVRMAVLEALAANLISESEVKDD